MSTREQERGACTRGMGREGALLGSREKRLRVVLLQITVQLQLVVDNGPNPLEPSVQLLGAGVTQAEAPEEPGFGVFSGGVGC